MNTFEKDIRTSAINAFFIVSARCVSDLSRFLNMISLSSYVFIISNSVYQFSIFMIFHVCGSIIASVASLPFFRKVQGKTALILINILCFFSMLLLIITPEKQHIYAFPYIAFINGFTHTMFVIGTSSQLPNWIIKSKLVLTNTWLISLSSMSAVVGSLIAGTLVATTGYQGIFLINCGVYVLVVGLLLPLKKMASHSAWASQSVSFKNEWRSLISELKKEPVLGSMLLITLIGSLGNAAHQIGFPIIAEQLIPNNISQSMGILMASWAIGRFLGARAIAYLLKKYAYLSLETLFLFGFSAMSLGFILVFQQHSQLWATAFIVAAGIGDGISDVSLISRIQTEPENLRLPMLSILALLKMTGFTVCMIIVAPFYTWLTLDLVILLFHGTPLIALVISQAWLRQRPIQL